MMDSDVTMKKSLTMKRIILLSVAMVLAAAAFAILTILSTNLARAQDGPDTLESGTAPSPVIVAGGGMAMIQPPHLILEQAVADGIITPEQAEQIRAKLGEVGFGNIEVFSDAGFGSVEFTSPLEHINSLLQDAVTDGRITQAEADQIRDDFEAGTLTFLAITDEGVYTNPDDVPEGSGVTVNGQVTTVDGSSFSFVIQSDGALPGAVPVLPDMPEVRFTPFAGKLNEVLSEAVSEGIITQAQMDEILALAETLGANRVFSAAAFPGPQLPNDWLLGMVEEALQDAAANGKITSEQADSLFQQLSDALSE
jgi:hypothetical protein